MLTDNDKKQLVQELKRLIASFDGEQTILIDTRQEYLNKNEIMEVITKAFDMRYHSEVDFWDQYDYPYLGNSYSLPHGHISGFRRSITEGDYRQFISLDKVIQNTLNIRMNQIKNAFIKEASFDEI